MGYTFTAESKDKNVKGGCIRRIYDDFSDPEYSIKQVIAWGQLRTLFGEPIYSSENYEERFFYCIAVEYGDNPITYLNVYSGGSGLIIGGNNNEQSNAAADGLADYIYAAKPSDYDYQGYYMDGPSAVTQGIKGGVPYYKEEELHLPEEELQGLYERLYHLK